MRRGSGGIGVANAYAGAITLTERRLTKRADQVMEAAATFHINSPRGGPSINDFGQLRSAWGEAPAIEYGTLLDLILNWRITSPLFRAVVVNYAELETLYNRPNGAFALAELFGLVRDGR